MMQYHGDQYRSSELLNLAYTKRDVSFLLAALSRVLLALWNLLASAQPAVSENENEFQGKFLKLSWRIQLSCQVPKLTVSMIGSGFQSTSPSAILARIPHRQNSFREWQGQVRQGSCSEWLNNISSCFHFISRKKWSERLDDDKFHTILISCIRLIVFENSFNEPKQATKIEIADW